MGPGGPDLGSRAPRFHPDIERPCVEHHTRAGASSVLLVDTFVVLRTIPIALLVAAAFVVGACTPAEEAPRRPTLQEPLADAEPPAAIEVVLYDLAELLEDTKQ